MCNINLFLRWVTVYALIVLAGCARVYTDKPVPHTELNDAITTDNVDIVSVNARAVPKRFTEALLSHPIKSASTIQALFDSPSLNALLTEIRANDIELLIARKQLRFSLNKNNAAQLDIYPSLNARLNGEITTVREMDPVRQLGLKLSTKWEIDVWGIVQDQIRTDNIDVTLQKIAMQDAEQSLLLKGIRAWLNAILQNKLLDIAQQEARLQTRLVTAIKQRVQAGLLSASEYDSSKRQLEILERNILSKRRDVTSAQRQLIMLMTKFEDSDIASMVPATFPTVAPLNTDIVPVNALLRRTDIKKAYWTLVKSDLNARIAYYNQFPRIMLTASKQSGGKSLASLLDFSQITAQLTSHLARQLVGDDETVLRAEQQKLMSNIDYLRYQKVILLAFHEVEQALLTHRESENEIKQAKIDLAKAELDEARMQERFFSGLSDYLQQQSAQKAIFSAKRAILVAEHARILRRVELANALGYAY